MGWYTTRIPSTIIITPRQYAFLSSFLHNSNWDNVTWYFRGHYTFADYKAIVRFFCPFNPCALQSVAPYMCDKSLCVRMHKTVWTRWKSNLNHLNFLFFTTDWTDRSVDLRNGILNDCSSNCLCLVLDVYWSIRQTEHTRNKIFIL